MQQRAAPRPTSWACLHTLTLSLQPRSSQIFDWHSIALFRSHNVSGQQGGITRLLACSKEQLKTYRGLDIGPTFVHKNHRSAAGQNYAAYNKPASVNYWVHSGQAAAVSQACLHTNEMARHAHPRPRALPPQQTALDRSRCRQMWST